VLAVLTETGDQRDGPDQRDHQHRVREDVSEQGGLVGKTSTSEIVRALEEQGQSTDDVQRGDAQQSVREDLAVLLGRFPDHE
jgi:hypothetical protein